MNSAFDLDADYSALPALYDTNLYMPSAYMFLPAGQVPHNTQYAVVPPLDVIMAPLLVGADGYAMGYHHVPVPAPQVLPMELVRPHSELAASDYSYDYDQLAYTHVVAAGPAAFPPHVHMGLPNYTHLAHDDGVLDVLELLDVLQMPQFPHATTIGGYATPLLLPILAVKRDGEQAAGMGFMMPMEHQAFGQPTLIAPRTKQMGLQCGVCNKFIRRDMSRHMRTHEAVLRFQCHFLLVRCLHKTHQFNRPYDYKKHLLNMHFQFLDPQVKKMHNLNEKLPHAGKCACDQLRVFNAREWLELHILTNDRLKQCALLREA